jgi:alpha-glucosidase (family GH31 glycosyl hydrolase)
MDLYIWGNARFTFLTERMVRLEWSTDGDFEDRPTLAVVNRDMPAVEVAAEEDGQRLILSTSALRLTSVNDGTVFSPDNLQIEFSSDETPASWTPGMVDTQNLGATLRTLDGVNGNRKRVRIPNPDYIESEQGRKKVGPEGQCVTEHIIETPPVDLGKGLISRGGWTLIDDTENVVIDDTRGTPWVKARPEGVNADWYFMAYGHDYRAALSDGAKVFGAQPLPPRYTLGYWFSRYWAYTDTELEALADSFERLDVPLDVMVVDMDWHLEGWTGYTWDKRYFPDPDDFLAEMQKRGLKTTLNLHPADGVGKHEEQFEAMAVALGQDPAKTDRVEFDITDPDYMGAYFKILHHPEEARGVDFWWMDWQQGETAAIKGLDTLPWINYLHWHDMAENPAREGRRPLIFSRYGGLGAGRYCIGFSGDTHSNWESLAFQPYFTATASNVLYGYWSHDIGGHQPGEIEPELYTRWMQYGTFSPILRTHTSKNPDAERRVWEYPSLYSAIMMDTIRLRYELVPYIYSECRKAYESGISLCRPMYYDHPEEDEAYKAKQQYMFGDEMLVAPVVVKADDKNEMARIGVWLPKGEWVDTARGCIVEGGGMFFCHYMLNEIPIFVRPGTVMPGQLNARRLNAKSIENLLVTVYGGTQGDYTLYEDDGLSTGYETGEYATIRLSHRREGRKWTLRLDPPEGGYDGFETEKSLEIRLAGSVPPETVEIDGEKLPFSYRQHEGACWQYDGDNAMIIVSLPTRDLSEGVEVCVALQDVDGSLADGLKGFMHRVQRANYYNTLATHASIIHEKERLGAEIAQIGNRISRIPESFESEIRKARKAVTELPSILEYMSLNPAAWESPEDVGPQTKRYAYCQKAIAILGQTSASPDLHHSRT